MKNFAYADFFVRKLKLIFVPFVVVSLVGLGFRCLGWHVWALLGNYSVQLLVYGPQWFVLSPHWYIPFVVFTFALSPLHIGYTHLNKIPQLFLLVFLSVIAMFMHRPESNINVLQSVIYFTPFYLLGILFSRYADVLRLWRQGLFAVSICVVALAVYLQTYVFVHIGNYHKQPFVYAGVDLQFIRMLFGCLLMLELSYRIKPGLLANHLMFLASLSFPIFFIHPLFTMGIENILDSRMAAEWVKSKSLWAALAATVMIFIIQCYGSVAVILSVRHLLGQRSRWFIG